MIFSRLVFALKGKARLPLPIFALCVASYLSLPAFSHQCADAQQAYSAMQGLPSFSPNANTQDACCDTNGIVCTVNPSTGEKEITSISWTADGNVGYFNSANQFSIDSSCALWNIPTLVKLDLSGSPLTSFQGYSGSNLQHLVLSRCILSGPLDVGLFALSTLEYLDMSNNQLSGSISSPQETIVLDTIILSSNQFSSVDPTNFKNLFHMSIGNNPFTDPVFPFAAFAGTFGSRLAILSISQTQFASMSPNVTLTDLQKFKIDNTQFASLPDTIFSSSLRYLNARSSKLTGSINPMIANAQNLQSLDLSNNNLTGSFPPLGAGVNTQFLQLGYLNLENNQLSCFNGSSLAAINNLYLGSNQLVGNFPSDNFSAPSNFWPNIKTIDISLNQISSISENIFPLTFERLYASGNLLTALPDSLFLQFPNIVQLLVLVVSNNRFSGELETTLPLLQYPSGTLTTLDLRGNTDLKGVFPAFGATLSAFPNLGSCSLQSTLLCNDDFPLVPSSCLSNSFRHCKNPVILTSIGMEIQLNVAFQVDVVVNGPSGQPLTDNQNQVTLTAYSEDCTQQDNMFSSVANDTAMSTGIASFTNNFYPAIGQFYLKAFTSGVCSDCVGPFLVKPTECQVVKNAYISMNGPLQIYNFANLFSCCGSYGVTCDSHGHITGLDWSNLNQMGQEFDMSWLLQLPFLKDLDLSGNDFTRQIPDLAIFPATLEKLSLGRNSMYGDIYSSAPRPNLVYFGCQQTGASSFDPTNLPNLATVMVGGNQFMTDSVFPSNSYSLNSGSGGFGHALVWLDISSSSFTSIDSGISLGGLEHLDIHNTGFAALPDGIYGASSSLKYLNVENCYLLVGQFPDPTKDVPQGFLSVGCNLKNSKLCPDSANTNFPSSCGVVPSCSLISQCEFVESAFNMLGGRNDYETNPSGNCCSPGFGHVTCDSSLTKVIEINWGGIGREGFMVDFSPLPDLVHLHLSGNAIHGTVSDMSSLVNLKYLDLNDNRFSGPVPDLPASLEYLRMSSTGLTGVFPANGKSGADFPFLDGAYEGVVCDFNPSLVCNNDQSRLPRACLPPFRDPFPLCVNPTISTYPWFNVVPGDTFQIDVSVKGPRNSDLASPVEVTLAAFTTSDCTGPPDARLLTSNPQMTDVVTGIASFANSIYTGDGAVFFKATVDGTNSPCSAGFSITNIGPHSLVFENFPNPVVIGGGAGFAFSVKATYLYKSLEYGVTELRPLPNADISLFGYIDQPGSSCVEPINPSSAFGGTLTATTDSSGIAYFSNVVLTQFPPSGFHIQASSFGTDTDALNPTTFCSSEINVVYDTSECDNAKAAYLSMNGNVYDWADPYCCGRYGITCDSDLKITGISWAGSGLSGPFLTAYLSSISMLTSLDVSGNDISGVLPDMTAIPLLQHLDLHSTKITSLASSFITSLTSLSYLDVSDTSSLSGDFPANGNYFSGVLSYCALSGTILCKNDPTHVPSACGEIPSCALLTTCATVKIAYDTVSGSNNVFSNQFTGNCCSSPGITCDSSLSKITEIAWVGIALSGTMYDFSVFTDLKKLDLHGNAITGTLPDLSLMAFLTYLDLNDQIGRMSGDVQSLPASLEFLRLSGTGIGGVFPPNGGSSSSFPALTQCYLGSLLCNDDQNLVPSACLPLSYCQTPVILTTPAGLIIIPNVAFQLEVIVNGPSGTPQTSHQTEVNLIAYTDCTNQDGLFSSNETGTDVSTGIARLTRNFYQGEGQFYLKAFAHGVYSTCIGPFTTSYPAADSITFTALPNSVVVGTEFTVSIRVTYLYQSGDSRPLANAPVTLSGYIDPTGNECSTFIDPITAFSSKIGLNAMSDSNGVATFMFLLLTKTPPLGSSFHMYASSPGLSDSVTAKKCSAPIPVAADMFSGSLTLTFDSAVPREAGSRIVNAPSAVLLDQYSNPISSTMVYLQVFSDAAFQSELLPGKYSVSPQTTASNGSVVFSDLTVNLANSALSGAQQTDPFYVVVYFLRDQVPVYSNVTRLITYPSLQRVLTIVQTPLSYSHVTFYFSQPLIVVETDVYGNAVWGDGISLYPFADEHCTIPLYNPQSKESFYKSSDTGGTAVFDSTPYLYDANYFYLRPSRGGIDDFVYACSPRVYSDVAVGVALSSYRASIQIGQATGSFSDGPAVRVVDGQGNLINGHEVRVNVYFDNACTENLSTHFGTESYLGGTVTSSSSRDVFVTDLTILKKGTFYLAATDNSALGLKSPECIGIQVNVSSVRLLSFTQFPLEYTPSQAFSLPPAVSISDDYNNEIEEAAVILTGFTDQTCSTPLPNPITESYQVSNFSGLATFAPASYDYNDVGDIYLMASVDNFKTSCTGPIKNASPPLPLPTPNPSPSSINVFMSQSTVEAGSLLSPVIQVKDQSGNGISGISVWIELYYDSGSTSPVSTSAYSVSTPLISDSFGTASFLDLNITTSGLFYVTAYFIQSTPSLPPLSGPLRKRAISLTYSEPVAISVTQSTPILTLSRIPSSFTPFRLFSEDSVPNCTVFDNYQNPFPGITVLLNAYSDDMCSQKADDQARSASIAFETTSAASIALFSAASFNGMGPMSIYLQASYLGQTSGCIGPVNSTIVAPTTSTTTSTPAASPTPQTMDLRASETSLQAGSAIGLLAPNVSLIDQYENGVGGVNVWLGVYNDSSLSSPLTSGFTVTNPITTDSSGFGSFSDLNITLAGTWYIATYFVLSSVALAARKRQLSTLIYSNNVSVTVTPANPLITLWSVPSSFSPSIPFSQAGGEPYVNVTDQFQNVFAGVEVDLAVFSDAKCSLAAENQANSSIIATQPTSNSGIASFGSNSYSKASPNAIFLQAFYSGQVSSCTGPISSNFVPPPPPPVVTTQQQPPAPVATTEQQPPPPVVTTEQEPPTPVVTTQQQPAPAATSQQPIPAIPATSVAAQISIQQPAEAVSQAASVTENTAAPASSPIRVIDSVPDQEKHDSTILEDVATINNQTEQQQQKNQEQEKQQAYTSATYVVAAVAVVGVTVAATATVAPSVSYAVFNVFGFQSSGIDFNGSGPGTDVMRFALGGTSAAAGTDADNATSILSAARLGSDQVVANVAEVAGGGSAVPFATAPGTTITNANDMSALASMNATASTTATGSNAASSTTALQTQGISNGFQILNNAGASGSLMTSAIGSESSRLTSAIGDFSLMGLGSDEIIYARINAAISSGELLRNPSTGLLGVAAASLESGNRKAGTVGTDNNLTIADRPTLAAFPPSSLGVKPSESAPANSTTTAAFHRSNDQNV